MATPVRPKVSSERQPVPFSLVSGTGFSVGCLCFLLPDKVRSGLIGDGKKLYRMPRTVIELGPSRELALPITSQHTQESLCVAHIYALAGMAGLNYAIRHVFDYGVDGQFSLVTVRNGRRVNSGYPLDFQAKATINWERKDGFIIYDLEAKTYNDIVSRTEAETTLILILLCMPRDQADWHVAEEDATTLRNCCYWHSFTGEPTENAQRKRICIPVENRLTPDVLSQLLALERDRRQNQV